MVKARITGLARAQGHKTWPVMRVIWGAPLMRLHCSFGGFDLCGGDQTGEVISDEI
jgi:hypothetical protein